MQHSLLGDNTPLKEYVIGVEVFDKPESFDPKSDPIVRVQAGRLRSRLKEYYNSEGIADTVVIELTQRGYAPVAYERSIGASDAVAGVAPPVRAPTMLRRRSVLLAGAGAAAALAGVWWLDRRSPSWQGNRISIAVLPFVNLGPSSENEYFVDGLTEEVINTLASVPGLKVVSRTSAFQFRHRPTDVREVGRLLRVDTVLEGSVRLEKNHFRVTAQLINVRDGFHLWSSTYDREASAIITVQEQIAAEIVDQFRKRSANIDLSRHPRLPPNNVQAFDLYLKGRYLWHRFDYQSVSHAAECFQTAVALDPGFSAAYAGLSRAYNRLANLEVAPVHGFLDQAKATAAQAVRLDDMSDEAHTAFAGILVMADWNWAAAEREYKRALELGPSSLSAHCDYANLCLSPQGRHEDAISHVRLARETDPVSPFALTFLGAQLVWGRQYDSGGSVLREALDLDSNYAQAHIMLGMAYLGKSDYPAALASFRKARNISPDNSYAIGHLGYTEARLGHLSEAEQTIGELAHPDPSRSISAVDIAGVYIGLGQRETTFQWLRRAYEWHTTKLVFVPNEPRFDPLRGAPQFATLLQRINLNP
ncbi:MAG: tetratricopeptide repeat protein [Acidobacteriia bacterium]|nr:tetratricopeptide repeat protein [Terriglobia bacterium]